MTTVKAQASSVPGLLVVAVVPEPKDGVQQADSSGDRCEQVAGEPQEGERAPHEGFQSLEVIGAGRHR